MKSKRNIPIQKPWGWFNSIPEMKEQLAKTCTLGSHQHDNVTGSELAQTAQYPPKLCLTFAKVIMGNRAREIQDHLETFLAILRSESVFANDGVPEEVSARVQRADQAQVEDEDGFENIGELFEPIAAEPEEPAQEHSNPGT